MGVSDDRAKDVKRRVEALKVDVLRLQSELPELRMRAEGRLPGGWTAYNEKKKAWTAAMTQLCEAKAELRELSGTTGGDPKWDLIRVAYRVLTRLDEAGIDIGTEGAQLLADIEFHVPTSKLAAALEGDSP